MRTRAILSLVPLLAVAAPAVAGTINSSLTITAEVTAACVETSPTTMNFVYSELSSVSVPHTLQLSCAGGAGSATASIEYLGGLTSVTSPASLDYSLWEFATDPFGSPINKGSPQVYAMDLTTPTQPSLQLELSIAAGQSVPPGLYSETVTVTYTFN